MVVKKRLRNFMVFGFATLMVAPLFFSLLISTAPVEAAGTAEWVDNATVRYDGRLFRDTKIDADWHFFALTDSDNCKDEIDDMSYDPKSDGQTPSDNKVTYSRNGPEGGSCGTLSTDGDITLTKPENAQFGFRWVNKGLVLSADERRQFRFDEGESIYINSTNEDDVCRDIITAGANKNTVSLIVKRGRVTGPFQTDGERSVRLRDDYNGYTFVKDIDYDKETNNGACISSHPVTVKVSEPDKANQPAGSGEDGFDSSAGAGEAAEPTCESEGWQLSWIICPVLYLGDATLRKLDQAIISLLSVPNDYYDETKNPELKEAWTRVRDIAYILLLPVVLVMVISTALGFDFVNAYTVKKALPRLIAATMFIALSFEITKFLVVLTNDVGTGVHGLIIGSFTGRGAEEISLASVFSPNNSDSIVSAPIFAAAIAGAAAVGSIGIILSYILVGIVALAVGFFLLSLRQMLLIALMLVAPVAILAWIFPGNDKMWKLWWGTFSKLLLLFPLIMLLIAVGKSFATMVADTDGSFVSTLIKLVAYVGPYFLIPATFKFAGGLFATVAGMANDRERGLLDRNKKYRQAKMSNNWSNAKAGTKFNRGSLNALSSRATTRGFGLTGRGRQAYQQKMDLAAMEHAKSPQGIAAQHNDGLLRAQTYESEADARSKMAADWGMDESEINTAILGAKANGGWGRARQVYAAKALSQTGTGFDSLEQVASTIARASHGNESQMSSLAGDINASTKQAGRPDLAPGYSKLKDLSVGAAGLEGGSSDFHGARVAASRGMDTVSILRGKPKDVKNLTEALGQHLTTQTSRMKDANLTREERQQAGMEVKQTIGQIKQLHASRSYASQDNQMTVNELVAGTDSKVQEAIDAFGGQPNAQEHMDDINRFSAPIRDQNDPRLTE